MAHDLKYFLYIKKIKIDFTPLIEITNSLWLDCMLQVLSVEEPPVREAGEKVEDVSQLVSKLKEAGCI